MNYRKKSKHDLCTADWYYYLVSPFHSLLLDNWNKTKNFAMKSNLFFLDGTLISTLKSSGEIIHTEDRVLRVTYYYRDNRRPFSEWWIKLNFSSPKRTIITSLVGLLSSFLNMVTVLNSTKKQLSSSKDSKFWRNRTVPRCGFVSFPIPTSEATGLRLKVTPWPPFLRLCFRPLRISAWARTSYLTLMSWFEDSYLSPLLVGQMQDKSLLILRRNLGNLKIIGSG